MPLDGEQKAFEVLLWFGVYVLLMLVAGVFLFWLRKRLRRRPVEGEEVFTLEQLRRLRDEGELSAGEYDLLKRKIAGGMAGIAQRSKRT